MKIFILLVFLILGGACCAFSQTASTTVTSMTVNEAESYDLEVYMDSSNNIFLPVKQIAKIFNIPISMNHSQKEIIFCNFEEKKVRINRAGAFVDDNKQQASVFFQIY